MTPYLMSWQLWFPSDDLTKYFVVLVWWHLSLCDTVANNWYLQVFMTRPVAQHLSLCDTVDYIMAPESVWHGNQWLVLAVFVTRPVALHLSLCGTVDYIMALESLWHGDL